MRTLTIPVLAARPLSVTKARKLKSEIEYVRFETTALVANPEGEEEFPECLQFEAQDRQETYRRFGERLFCRVRATGKSGPWITEEQLRLSFAGKLGGDIWKGPFWFETRMDEIYGRLRAGLLPGRPEVGNGGLLDLPKEASLDARAVTDVWDMDLHVARLAEEVLIFDGHVWEHVDQPVWEVRPHLDKIVLLALPEREGERAYVQFSPERLGDAIAFAKTLGTASPEVTGRVVHCQGGWRRADDRDLVAYCFGVVTLNETEGWLGQLPDEAVLAWTDLRRAAKDLDLTAVEVMKLAATVLAAVKGLPLNGFGRAVLAGAPALHMRAQASRSFASGVGLKRWEFEGGEIFSGMEPEDDKAIGDLV